MIPSDVVSRLQLTADAAVTRVPTPQQVTDALADLVPGQRVLAEIQALLPNGAYRALINQRDVTLALPFSAKAGDSLELEVVESEGKLTLAVVARKDEAGAAALQSERPAVETTFSRTGNFIAGLLGRGED
ncbi:MAG: flagellar hook-length control protein FliK, partial [Rhodocyclaceae bacterium]